MSRGREISGDLMSLAEIGNGFFDSIAELKRNSVERSEEFAEGLLKIVESLYKQIAARQAAVARAAHAIAEAKGKKPFRKLAKTEIITNKLYISVFEEFVEEYQDALDSLRKDLAPYYSSTTNHPQRPARPLPPPIATSPPPPPIPDVDYDNDNEAFEKRREELRLYHGLQANERDQISEYQDAIDDKESGLDEIDFALDLFRCRILRAIEFYAVNNLGLSPYSDQATHEKYMRLINNDRIHLEVAGFNPNGYPL